MGLDIWFKEDIRAAILAANEASSATAEVVTELVPSKRILDPEEGDDALIMTLRAYRRGYKAALTTVALAFGLTPTVIAMIRGRPMEDTLLAPPDAQKGAPL